MGKAILEHAAPRGRLALTRRVGESLVLQTLDGPIRLDIVHLNKGRVRIVLDAPASVRIVRAELLTKALGTKPEDLLR